MEPARTDDQPRDRDREDARCEDIEAGVVSGAVAPVGDPRRAEAVPAELEGRGDVDGAIERAGEEPPGELRLPDRGGAGAAQLRRVAEARGVGGGHRHKSRNQGRGQSRASRDRPQGAEDPVGIDAGRVNGEGDEDDECAQAEDAAFDDRLEGDVDPAEYGQSPRRAITVSPLLTTIALTTTIRSASVIPIQSAARTARPAPARAPAVTAATPTATSTIGLE